MPENNPDTELYWLIGIVAVFFLILLLFGLVSFINDFSQELRYLNNEISCCFTRPRVINEGNC